MAEQGSPPKGEESSGLRWPRARSQLMAVAGLIAFLVASISWHPAHAQTVEPNPGDRKGEKAKRQASKAPSARADLFDSDLEKYGSQISAASVIANGLLSESAKTSNMERLIKEVSDNLGGSVEKPPDLRTFIVAATAGTALSLLDHGLRDQASVILRKILDLHLEEQQLKEDPWVVSSAASIAMQLATRGESTFAFEYWKSSINDRRLILARKLKEAGGDFTVDFNLGNEVRAQSTILLASVDFLTAQGRANDAFEIARLFQSAMNLLPPELGDNIRLRGPTSLVLSAIKTRDEALLSRALEWLLSIVKASSFTASPLFTTRWSDKVPGQYFLVRDVTYVASNLQQSGRADLAANLFAETERVLEQDPAVPRIYADWLRFLAARNVTCYNPKLGSDRMEAIWKKIQSAFIPTEEFSSYPLTLAWGKLAAGNKERATFYVNLHENAKKSRKRRMPLTFDMSFFKSGIDSDFYSGWLQLALNNRRKAIEKFNEAIDENKSVPDQLLYGLIEAGEFKLGEVLLAPNVLFTTSGASWVTQPVSRTLEIASLVSYVLGRTGHVEQAIRFLGEALVDPNVDSQDLDSFIRFRPLYDRGDDSLFASLVSPPPILRWSESSQERDVGRVSFRRLETIGRLYIALADIAPPTPESLETKWQIAQWNAYDSLAHDFGRGLVLRRRGNVLPFDLERQTLARERTRVESNALSLRSFDEIADQELIVPPCAARVVSNRSFGGESVFSWPSLVAIPDRVRFGKNISWKFPTLSAAVSADTAQIPKSIGVGNSPTLKMIQSSLDPDEMVIHTSVFPEFVQVHSLTANAASSWLWRISKDDLEKRISRLRTVSSPNDRGEVEQWNAKDFELAHMFYENLIGRAKVTQISSTTTITFILDPLLATLPTSTLIMREYGTEIAVNAEVRFRKAPWLDKRFASRFLPSVQSRLDTANGRAEYADADFSVVAFSDPILSESADCGRAKAPSQMCRLRYTSNIASLLAQEAEAGKSRLFLRNDADKITFGSFVGAGASASMRFLGVFTHGLTPPETARLVGIHDAALIFSKPGDLKGVDAERARVLTASEIGAGKIDADLVLLLSCNSASSGSVDSGGYTGLAEAFLRAGARSVLVSHWPLFEQSAEALIPALWRLNQLSNKSAALRRAIQIVRDSSEGEDMSHPAYWAGFTLVGR